MFVYYASSLFSCVCGSVWVCFSGCVDMVVLCVGVSPRHASPTVYCGSLGGVLALTHPVDCRSVGGVLALTHPDRDLDD